LMARYVIGADYAFDEVFDAGMRFICGSERVRHKRPSLRKTSGLLLDTSKYSEEMFLDRNG